MKKKLLSFVLIFLGVVTLVACGSKVDFTSIKEEVSNIYQTGDKADSVTKDLILATKSTKNAEAVIKWTSSDTSVLSTAGKVYPKATDTDVTLTLTIEVAKKSQDFKFELKVKAKEEAPDVVVKYTLTLGVGLEANKTGQIEKDTSVTITVKVPEGKLLDKLTVNGVVVVVVDNKYTFTITKDTTASVTFKDHVIPVITYTLTVNEGLTADKTGDIAADTLVTLTITIPTGKELDKLTVNGTVVTVTNNKYSFNITQNTEAVVTFKEKSTAQEITVKSSFTSPDGTAMTGDGTTNNAELFGFNPTIFTVTSLPDGAYGNKIAFYAKGGMRIYSARETGEGASFTVKANKGYVISKVSIEFSEGNKNPNSALLNLGSEALSLGASDITSTTYTKASLSIDGFSFKNSQHQPGTGFSSNQIRILSISITYSEGTPTSVLPVAVNVAIQYLPNTKKYIF